MASTYGKQLAEPQGIGDSVDVTFTREIQPCSNMSVRSYHITWVPNQNNKSYFRIMNAFITVRRISENAQPA